MSMELWVLSDRRLASIEDWQAAIDANGYPLQLSTEVAFEKLNGFLPSHLNNQLTGFECYHDEPAELVGVHLELDFRHSWRHALGIRWGYRKDELRAAWIAGSAYAQATEGVVFDGQEGKARNATEALEVARVEYDTPEVDISEVLERALRRLRLGPYNRKQ